jgi:hypothetical protein
MHTVEDRSLTRSRSHQCIVQTSIESHQKVSARCMHSQLRCLMWEIKLTKIIRLQHVVVQFAHQHSCCRRHIEKAIDLGHLFRNPQVIRTAGRQDGNAKASTSCQTLKHAQCLARTVSCLVTTAVSPVFWYDFSDQTECVVIRTKHRGSIVSFEAGTRADGLPAVLLIFALSKLRSATKFQVPLRSCASRLSLSKRGNKLCLSLGVGLGLLLLDLS